MVITGLISSPVIFLKRSDILVRCTGGFCCICEMEHCTSSGRGREAYEGKWFLFESCVSVQGYNAKNQNKWDTTGFLLLRLVYCAAAELLKSCGCFLDEWPAFVL